VKGKSVSQLLSQVACQEGFGVLEHCGRPPLNTFSSGLKLGLFLLGPNKSTRILTGQCASILFVITVTVNQVTENNNKKGAKTIKKKYVTHLLPSCS